MDTTNRLYFGDCLDVMREDIPDESVDLIYLDPPFNSKRLYNAFIGGAQWVAFDDTWRWSEAVDDFHEVASQPALARTMEGLRPILGEGANLAYLSYMANRLVECRRVLKSTGSIYLHCDPTFSHYLKIVMDGIFEPRRFLNEVVWHYKSFHGNVKRYYARKHDTLLMYTKSSKWKFNRQWEEDNTNTIDFERWRDYLVEGRYIYAANMPEQDSRFTRYLRRWIGENGREPGPDDMVYEVQGQALDTVWDIKPIDPKDKSERLGYPTQKPLALLERIIKASSNQGDVVLDPFCGCGTTIEAAQRLDRRWIGIDICVNACKVIERRINSHFDSLWDDVEFIGMPKTIQDAKTLASLDKFRFERWAASLVDGMEANTRQRGDKGIDGWGRLPIRKGQFIDLVSQVKGGSTGPGDVQAFNGARQQAGADLGIFTCFDDRVTQGMRDTAASAGRFMETPVVQIYTVEDYFAGRVPALPRVA